MSLYLITKSHGIIECGFYGAFMKLSRIGEYCFETRDLCQLAQNLAENSELKEARIFGYNEDKFWEMEGKYNLAFVQKRVEAYLGEKDETEDFVKKNRELTLEEKTELMNDKIEVPVTISKTGKSVNMGKYEIENHYFAQMLYYILNGGYIGWRDFVPVFVKPALSAIETSKNLLYEP